MAGKRKRIEIREADIPNIEIKVFSNAFQPLGTYSLPNFFKKYKGL